MSESTSITPTFRGEFYFLIAKFLEDGPCKEAAELLRKQITEKALVPPRFDWTGGSHVKTFRDIEEEFGFIAPEYLLKRCFELCSAIGDPKGPQTRSLVQKSVKSKRSLFRIGQLEDSVVHNIFKTSVGSVTPAKIWHERYLCSKIKYLRRNLGHLSSVYCLTFDRTGQIVITGADDSLVKCWSAIDGRLIHTLRGSTSEIADMTVSHDNRLLAVGSNDRLIRVYDLQTAAPVAISSRHSSLITAVNFCPKSLSDNSFYLASTARDGCVSFWKYRYNDQNEVVFDETPTRYHERIRPGLAAIICASFSPGGNFFVVGSIDHHVRVYKMDTPEGPQRIFEDDAHSEGVDSVQWCNQPVMRFLSGSRDCTARIWTFSNNKWSSILLDMSLGEGSNKKSRIPSTPSEPVPGTSSGITDGNRGASRLQANSQSLRPLRAAAAAAASTIAHANYNDDDYLAQQRANERLQAQQSSSRPRVTMVAWTTDDKHVITAVSNFTLKIWKSCDGQLITTLSGHKDEIYVLEPHPVSVNILLTGAHDGQIRVWDLSTFQCIYEHTNNVENQQENSGDACHASVFDAKWSPDGTLISASDSHGQIIFLGHGSSERYDKLPTELFFHTDYRPLLRDSFHNVVDEQTQLPPHLMPPPFLVDSDGAPYSANIQRFAPGREGLSDQEALLPFGADVGPQEEHHRQIQPNGQPLIQPEIAPEVIQDQENIPPRPANEVQMVEVFAGLQQPGLLNIPQPNIGLNLVALANRKNKSVIEINNRRICELSSLETEYYSLHTQRESHNQNNFSSKSRTLKQQKRNFQSTQNRSQPRPRQRPANNSRSHLQQRVDENDDDEEENDDDEVDDNNEENQARNSGEDTSDLSLSESDLSEESTTEESSEHSDWGSDHGGGAKSPTSALTSPPLNTKKKSPKAKKRRRAAQKCRELIQNGSVDNEAFMPSPWLSDTIPRKSPYFPQIGDILMYFKQGHENYIELVKQRNTYKINMREVQFLKKKSVPEFCLVKIVNLKVEIRPPRLVVLKLAVIDTDTWNPVGDSFTIKYHDMNDVVDFLVLQQTYATIRGKHWKKGDRIRCQIDDCWWKGTINKVEPYEDSRRSPFLAIHVHWDNSEKERLSPWDIEALDGDSAQLDDGTPVTADQLSSCLYVPTAEEWNGIGRDSECERISEALQAIMELAISEPFNYPVDLTVYPEYVVEVEYPVDLTMVKSRVDNRFYRRIDAILFDLKFIYENAASFNLPKSDIVKNAKIIWQTASDIIKSPLKTKDDVSAVYHRFVETFEWSLSDSSDSDENEESPNQGRGLRNQKISKKQDPLNPKQWKRDCNDLLNDMFKHPLSDPFREPVSEIEYPDYQRIVSTPMDLTMVRESLHSGEYETPTALQKDVQLIFKNSRTYNTNSRSKVWTMTTKLEEWFEKRMMKLLYEWRKTKRKIAVGHNRIDRTMSRGKSKGKGDSTRSKNRKPSDSESFGSSDKDDDSDDSFDENGDNEKEPIPSTSSGRRQSNFNTSKPCSSRSVRQSFNHPSTSEPGPSSLQDAQTGLNHTDGFRRTSSRPHRLPARLSDDIPSTSQGISRGPFYRNANNYDDDDDDDDDDDEEKPLAVVRAKRLREEIGESSQGGRPKRAAKSKLQDTSKESEDQSSDEENEESSDEEVEESEQEAKNLRGQKRKVPKEETVSAKKPRRDEASSDDDEDVPLSTMRRIPLRATFSPQHTVSARPQRAAKKSVKSLAEQSEEDDDEDSPLSERRRVGRAQARSGGDSVGSKRIIARRSQRAKVKDSEDEESSEEEETEEEEEDLDDEEDEDDVVVKTSSRRPTRGRPRKSRINGTRSLSKRGYQESDVDEEEEEDEDEDEEEDDDEEDDDEDNDLSPPAASKRSSRRRAASKLASKSNSFGRSVRQRNINHYEGSDNDGSSERENRRPVRAAAQRNKFTRRNHSDDSSYDDDEETGVVRKTKVTSRGRVCRPNPRII